MYGEIRQTVLRKFAGEVERVLEYGVGVWEGFASGPAVFVNEARNRQCEMSGGFWVTSPKASSVATSSMSSSSQFDWFSMPFNKVLK